MKNIYAILSIISLVFFTSCEEVVDIDLNSGPPKLVIDATIIWEKGTSGNEQKIKLTTTGDFYKNTVPIVSGAIITVKNSDNIVFDFIETPNTGEYICTNFIPVIDQEYTLTVVALGQTYTATETLKSVTPITTIEQNDEAGLSGNDIEIKTFFDDPDNEENFYLFRYKYSNKAKLDYYSSDDKFFQGNQFFSTSQNEDLSFGNSIQIDHYGISKQYYNYITILLNVAGNSGGGPFSSPPATVRGNIINQTNFSDYALGYFSLGESDKKIYIVQ